MPDAYMKIAVTIPKGEIRDGFFPNDVVKELESIGEVRWNDTPDLLEGKKLIELIQDADVCMTGWVSARFDREILDRAPKLKVVAHTGGSVAGIVSSCLYERGITVISGNKLYAESVAEGTIAYILCALRKIPYYQDEMQHGRWAPINPSTEGLLDKSLGLVGFGAVSRYLVRMLAPFRVKIKAYDPFVSDEVLREYGVERAELQDIFSKSNIISMHAAMTPDTYHIIGSELLESIPEGALLINTARAGIIDGDALIAELQKNRFQAVLDVFDVEPLNADSGLLGLPNAILLPHIAGPTMDRRKLVTLELIADIRRIFEGKKPENEIGESYAMSMTGSIQNRRDKKR